MKHTEKEAEEYFRQLARDRDKAENAYRHILAVMDRALEKENYDALWELITYIESGDGQLAYQYFGKTHRIFRILSILALEENYQKTLFCEGCDNVDALWERYMSTLFAFRRIQFRLSEESFQEAVDWLHNHPISHIAAYIILFSDLIIPDQALYKVLESVYAREWSVEEMQQFIAQTGSSFSDS